ncbi:glycosyltransferase family 4 protein [Novosphingobium resinovorum]|uniref:glycosyltransferase family 4 protein n=1 Tax=Novosphingobium TaxID=165696 RepID=UPI0025A0D301|nr:MULTISPECIES: glycosyltransferase family 4 protein [Novosphingobium]WJM25962.1 glycosyltransferase family 4 protein [Novosphingobium resinovorum]
MRILITIDAVGGVWQYGLDLARELAGAGAQPVLVVLGPAPDAAQRAEACCIPGIALIETQLPLDWLCDGPAPILAAGAAIADIAREMGTDLIQLNMPTLAAAGPFPVPTIAVTHGCVTTWWEAAKRGEDLASEYAWHRAMTGAGLRAADRVIAPTASHAHTVARHYALDRSPTVVHNGRSALSQQAEVPLPHDVLTVGRLWDRVKRADLLDRVAARIEAPFRAAGATTGPHGERADLRNLVLLGQLDREGLGSRLATRPIFVSAASFEPFGLAVLEAAQAGCALVLSNIDTFRELWDGVALFAARDDEAAYAHAIEILLGDPDHRLRLGETARRRAGRYSPGAMANGMLDIYRQVLGERAQSGRVAA